MNTSNRPILLFDGICNFCDQSVQFVIRHDKLNTFKFAALQSNVGQELLKKYNLPTENFDSFVFISNDRCYQKSTAALHVCRGLGGIWRILYLLIVIPRPLRDRFYNLVAKNRYKWFGKKDQCMIPSPEVRKRFL
ncbi:MULTISPECIES: thiol-disulfide oxidoreductase DCC family protein [Metabacillus]|jgi:predicted DCC family thiol-disulfide oxidoreductase YuxK|uniref:Thiol-disulfide oxidoreductase DCC family protein n=1 Tax=Metabacillus rhizolycopersici TaxID=2875709 RepID=A0ABS7UWN6_9BACI|nr:MULTISPECIES: thiol-disulfide oxidoreductase DCC family protein [Metabacillus]MBZ5752659.1 thiol-disulfide oxidoreductase DCC family protein [Metabacillus rhizolycopersici]MCM3651619.1 thiol-disulfide oxidoreductase DCC family protein [Metabacillus litoralis]